MKEYNAHFSYYSEQYGSFEETIVKVDAVNQFEARNKAWERLNDNEDIIFASCVKLCGITWDASKLDLQDYFNAEAAYEKYKIQYIENVEKPNAQIEKNDKKYEECERERYSCISSLHTISHIAEDLGKPLGMLPPALFEELHYAREFAYMPDCDFDKSSAMIKQIELAENWDSSAMFNIRELFKHGYGMANGYNLDFSAQFGKYGIYPVRADRTDYESKYISRWTNEREYKSISSLPFFVEKDIIANSQNMLYEWQTLVLKKDMLLTEKQTPINLLWVVNQDNNDNLGSDSDNFITVENLFTGEIAKWNRSDFFGVLRPEKIAKINVDTIKAEYQELIGKQSAEKSVPINGENKKPSILADVREKEKEIATNNHPIVQKNKQTGKEELS